MKTLLPCELSPQSPSLPFIRQFYVKQELCGLRRMETIKLLEQLIVDAVHIVFAEERDEVAIEGDDVVFIDAASFASIQCCL